MMDHNQTSPHVAIIGLGKIGLTLAAVFANNGCNVTGADINQEVVASVNRGKSHIDNEPGLEKLITNAHQKSMLRATTKTSAAVAESNIIVIIVPVLIDGQNQTDYHMIDRAVQDVATGIKPGSLVIFETTLPPGDSRNRFGQMIFDISGLRPGVDFHLAYSPERVYSNQIMEDLQDYPKVVGGIDRESSQRAAQFYKKVLQAEIIKVSSLETAEFAKVAECVYRDVNIALANELAQFAEEKEIPMTEVIKASNSQPYANLHAPGIGVGGHCIPIYPYFFINKGLQHGLVTLSRQINDSMATFAVKKIQDRIGTLSYKNVLILGLSYRENVKEPTKSSALLLIDQLSDKKANIFIHDPLFSNHEIKQYGVTPLSLEADTIDQIDIIIIQASHQEYQHLDFNRFSNCKLVFDGRNQLNNDTISNLTMGYESIGNESKGGCYNGSKYNSYSDG